MSFNNIRSGTFSASSWSSANSLEVIVEQNAGKTQVKIPQLDIDVELQSAFVFKDPHGMNPEAVGQSIGLQSLVACLDGSEYYPGEPNAGIIKLSDNGFSDGRISIYIESQDIESFEGYYL